MTSLIEMKSISKVYKMGEVQVHALQNVDFLVRQGEYIALIGSSGSGKSTLMNLIGCLDRPTNGQYFLDGKDVAKLSADERAFIRGRKLGFVFQNFNLLSRTSALENVELPLLYSDGNQSKEWKRRAVDALCKVGLENRMDHHPSQLSGGQQQRVAIARALVTNPSLILADEPTGNLDSKSGEEILQVLDKLNREGKTIILVSHDPSVAERAKRRVTLKDGCIVSDS